MMYLCKYHTGKFRWFTKDQIPRHWVIIKEFPFLSGMTPSESVMKANSLLNGASLPNM